VRHKSTEGITDLFLWASRTRLTGHANLSSFLPCPLLASLKFRHPKECPATLACLREAYQLNCKFIVFCAFGFEGSCIGVVEETSVSESSALFCWSTLALLYFTAHYCTFLFINVCYYILLYITTFCYFSNPFLFLQYICMFYLFNELPLYFFTPFEMGLLRHTLVLSQMLKRHTKKDDCNFSRFGGIVYKHNSAVTTTRCKRKLLD
jgi:hypothetical protein